MYCLMYKKSLRFVVEQTRLYARVLFVISNFKGIFTECSTSRGKKNLRSFLKVVGWLPLSPYFTFRERNSWV